MNRITLAAALLGTVAAAGAAWSQTPPVTPGVAKPLKGDTNQDGKLTRAEYVAQAEARFAALDTDKNGALTTAERPKHLRRASQMGAPGRNGRMAGGMARLDADGDGRITRAEFDIGSRARFARMDANADGRIDTAELAALPGGGRMLGGAAASLPLTADTFVAQAAQRFTRLDTNGDGVIDRAELQAHVQAGGRPGGRKAPAAPTGA